MTDSDRANDETQPTCRTSCSMCGAAIDDVARACRSCGEPFVEIIQRSWLRREIAVTLPEGRFLIEYDGNGFGYERVRVQPGTVLRKTSWLWYVPDFDFRIGLRAGQIDVRVAPWLAIRSFALRIDGNIVYSE